MEIPTKRGKRAPRLSLVVRRKLQKDAGNTEFPAFGSRGSEVRILSPRPVFLDKNNTLNVKRLDRDLAELLGASQ